MTLNKSLDPRKPDIFLKIYFNIFRSLWCLATLYKAKESAYFWMFSAYRNMIYNRGRFSAVKTIVR